MSTDTAPQFDPSQEVPDAYDIFCEACGYSLAGLTTDRCPECGAVFEPKELPFARIPWLHRRRLGKFNAYWKTVAMVCFEPRKFATEICRPVRISASDARSFRLTTIWLATIAFSLLPIALAGLDMLVFARLASRPAAIVFGYLTPSEILFAITILVALPATFHVMLRLATDMPLFIWKGNPSGPATELAPIQQYACAPLAFAPLLFASIACLFYLFIVTFAPNPNEYAFTGLSLALTAIIPAWLLSIALIFMHISSKPRPSRLLLLAAYLPFHWLCMVGVSFMGFCVVVMLATLAFHIR